MNITHIEKDKVLNWLCENDTYTKESMEAQTKLDIRIVNEILQYFERKGLIEIISFRYNMQEFDIHVKIEALDLFNHGGFTGIEFLLEENLHKLQLELKELQSTFPEKAKTLSAIASAITGTLALLFGR